MTRASIVLALIALLDGDGKPDLLSKHLLERRVAIHRGRGDGWMGAPRPLPGRSYAAGPGAYRITSADFDGNGRPDIVASSFGGDTITVLLGR